MSLKTFLSKLPNVRLLIEYAMIGLLIIMSATIFGLRTQVKGLEKSNEAFDSSVSELVAINRLQSEVLGKLVEMGILNRDQVALLVQDRKKILEEQSKHNTRISALEKDNEEVKAYLSGRIPEPLVCVLNKTC